jgi:ankyrin repeat protein
MGRTPLHQAVLARNEEMVRLLLAKGADLLVQSAHGNTALDPALQEDLSEITGLLSAAGYRS